MRHATTLLVLFGLAALSGAQQPPTHEVTITLTHDGQCTVQKVDPEQVVVDPGDKIRWTATDSSGQCGNKNLTLANFKLKDNGQAKDPVPGCNKKLTSGGAGITCTVTGAVKKDELYKYDVELEGGKGIDPEIRVRG